MKKNIIEKVGRNELCPCGSGLKFKKCCSDASKKNIIKHNKSLIKHEENSNKVYLLLVQLESSFAFNVNGEIWRKIEVLGENNLYDLHLIIQEAFDWDNDHMFSFFLSKKVWDRENEYKGDPLGGYEPTKMLQFWGEEKSKPAKKVKICDLKLRRGKIFKYLFDYGDEIIHTIKVLDIYDATCEKNKYPKIIEKLGEAPGQYGG